METGLRWSEPWGRSLGTTSPSVGRRRLWAPWPPWPPGLRKSQVGWRCAAARPSKARPSVGQVSLEQLKPSAVNHTQGSVKGLT